jgi:hypothetical protein
MADSTEKSILEQVADVLRQHDVKFRRPKDQESLMQLLAIKKVRQEQ